MGVKKVKKEVKKVFILFAIVAFVAGFAGCAQNQKVQPTQNTKTVKVFFYYETGCPNCRMIEPYMKLLKKELGSEVDFHFCNWDNHTKWSALEKKVYSETNPYGFPAVVVIHNGNKSVFIGWYEIGENFTKYLEKLGYPCPKVFYNRTSYSATECLNCHAKRHIPPPSTYNCTYCCHMANKSKTFI